MPTRTLAHLTTLWRNRQAQALFYQALFIAMLAALFYAMAANAVQNLRARGITTGFDFLATTSSFVISETVPLPLLDAQDTRSVAMLLIAGIVLWGLRRRLASSTVPNAVGPRLLTWLLRLALPAAALWILLGKVHFVSYAVPGTYELGLLTGFANTIKVAIVAIVLSLLLGLALGLCRLSPNWLISRGAALYLNIVRNVPLLLVIFFWYFGVIRALPGVRDSFDLSGMIVLNNRGVFLPEPVGGPGLLALSASWIAVAVALFFYRRYVRRYQERTGIRLPLLIPALTLLAVTAISAHLIFGPPVHWSFPILQGFNYEGGLVVTPEYASLLLALVIYAAAFISEIVRSAILAVPAEQTEAGLSLGLSRFQALRLIVLPQALRIAIPPTTATCLGLIKDTSLGVAIGYPELVSVGGTILDVSGHVLEVIAITIAFYMSLTLLFSALMSWYHARVDLVRR